jgi:phosphoribosylaminoimidazole-succinocarboxamide synthase
LIVALKLATSQELQKIKKISLEINRLLSAHLAKQGILLVDFKIEFGRQGKTIRLGDEISMDSMRLWDKLTKESLDKDVYRFNKGDVMATYNRVARRIMTRTARPAATKKKPVAAQRKGAGSPDRAVKSKTKKR